MRKQSTLVKMPEHLKDKSPRLANVKQFTNVNKGKKYPYGSKRQGFTKKDEPVE